MNISEKAQAIHNAHARAFGNLTVDAIEKWLSGEVRCPRDLKTLEKLRTTYGRIWSRHLGNYTAIEYSDAANRLRIIHAAARNYMMPQKRGELRQAQAEKGPEMPKSDVDAEISAATLLRSIFQPAK